MNYHFNCKYSSSYIDRILKIEILEHFSIIYRQICKAFLVDLDFPNFLPFIEKNAGVKVYY